MPKAGNPRRARKATPMPRHRSPSSRASSVSSRSSGATSSVLLSSASASNVSSGRSVTSLTRTRSYKRIKGGVKKSVPAAVVLWAFHKLPAPNGLTSYRIINFLKGKFRFNGKDNKKIGQSIGHMLKTAVDFGMLEKRGRRFFLSAHYTGEKGKAGPSKTRGRS